jgi:hypothetical protein
MTHFLIGVAVLIGLIVIALAVVIGGAMSAMGRDDPGNDR